MTEAFWDRLDRLVENRKAITMDLKIAPNSFTMWRERKTYPACNVAVALSKALGISVEYLVTGEDPSGLPPQILTIARKLAALRPDELAVAEATIDALALNCHRDLGNASAS